MATKPQEIEVEIDKLDFIKIKNFFASKDTVKKVKYHRIVQNISKPYLTMDSYIKYKNHTQ